MDKFIKAFIDEASELIADLEKALLMLETDLNNADGISTIFRSMHTLKGAAGMFGFEDVSDITHHLETIFQDIRDGARVMEPKILTTTFKTVDHLRNLFDTTRRERPEVKTRHEALLKEIADLNNSQQVFHAATSPLRTESKAEGVSTYYIYA